MKLRDVPTNVLFGRIAEELQLGAIGLQNGAVWADEMERNRPVFEKVFKIEVGEGFVHGGMVCWGGTSPGTGGRVRKDVAGVRCVLFRARARWATPAGRLTDF